MKKITILIILLTILLLGLITSFNVAKAASASVRLSATPSSGKVGDTISVYFSLQSFQGIDGLMAIGGFLKYDTNVLQYKSISSQNGWGSLNYNQSSGQFLTMQDDVVGRGNIFLVTFTVIGEPKSGTTTISVTGIDATDGETDRISTSGVSTTVGIIKIVDTDTGDKNEGTDAGNKNEGTDAGNKNEGTNAGNKNEGTNAGNKNEGTNKENTTDNKNNISNKDNDESKNDTDKTDTKKENINPEKEDQTAIEKNEQESNEKVDIKNQLIEQISKEKNNIQDKIIIAQYYSIEILKWATIGICVATLIVAAITLRKCIKEEKDKKD